MPVIYIQNPKGPNHFVTTDANARKRPGTSWSSCSKSEDGGGPDFFHPPARTLGFLVDLFYYGSSLYDLLTKGSAGDQSHFFAFPVAPPQYTTFSRPCSESDGEKSQD